jgi:hypothetical protein
MHSRKSEGAGVCILTAVAALSAGFAASAADSASRQRHGATVIAAPIERFPCHWSQTHVRELIALVEESRQRGFEPDDFGLPALRSELVQSVELYRRPTTVQLDSLACAAALALVRAYRHQDIVYTAFDTESRRDEVALAAALRADRLRDWIEAAAAGCAGGCGRRRGSNLTLRGAITSAAQ